MRWITGAYRLWYNRLRLFLLADTYQNSHFGYIRSLELQENGSPHWHALLSLGTPVRCALCDNDAISQDVYDAMRRFWPYGLSKFTYVGGNYSKALSYVLKYVSKSTSRKAVWAKVYAIRDALELFSQNQDGTSAYVDNLLDSGEFAPHLVEPHVPDTESPYGQQVWFNPHRKYGKVKLLTWTSNFPWHWFFQRIHTDLAFQALWDRYQAFLYPKTLLDFTPGVATK